MMFLSTHRTRIKPNHFSHITTFSLCTTLNSTHQCAQTTSPITLIPPNGFSNITNETVGKSLHAFCIKHSHPLPTFHTNTLINMYSKFNQFKSARHVFDEMPHRNEASWNTIISTLVRATSYPESFHLFAQMRAQGFPTNGFVIASLLTACTASCSMLNQGLQIHGLVLKNGLVNNVYVGTALVNFYTGYGLHSCARYIFDEMLNKNVVTWTSLMVGYSDSGDFVEVVKLYKRMRVEGVDGNQNTFTTVISASGLLEDEDLGCQVAVSILGHVVKFGYEYDLSVGNSLISMFGNVGKVEDARYVFDGMSLRDTISWNAMISVYARSSLAHKAFDCFKLMREGCEFGEKVDAITLSALLSVCGCMECSAWGDAVHGLVHKYGFSLNLTVCNTLLGMYSESGRSNETLKLFEEMPEKDLISWNSVLAGYVHDREYVNALKVFIKMVYTQTRVNHANHVTFASAITACSDVEFLSEAEIIHARVFTSGFQNNLVVGNALVTMYGKHKMTWKARQVFDMMPVRDLVTWNTLIGGYAECEESDNAFKVFNLMRLHERTNYITIVNILSSCIAPDHLRVHAMPLHAHVIHTGFISDDYVKNSLITMYGKCRHLDSSERIFNTFVNKDCVTWNAILAAHAHNGQGEYALKRFVEMNKMNVTGIRLDEFSCSAALAASASLTSLEEGQQVHALTVKSGFDSYPYVTTHITDMYGKCGEINDVLKMLPEETIRPRVLWNVLVSALARQGRFDEAEEAFNKMVGSGCNPDHVTFVSLLSACSHSGLVDAGLKYYSLITKFRVKVGIEHCVCIIDLLGRSGRLSEAEDFIKQMPVEPNDFVWRSILAACKIHGNLELGKRAVDFLLKSNPSDDSAFVLYSNVCASTGKWDAVHDLRAEMESVNVKKQPACSWVKIKRKVSSFAIGDKSHYDSDKIYKKLTEVKKMIKEAGYVVDTSVALQDVDDEQKEDHLWKHSERLALAYGLISTPQGSGLQIFKNLRVCVDCHSVFKFVSKIERRKIVLRDPFRYHHFSDGKCSCGDYW